jgi:hypothetical protein
MALVRTHVSEERITIIRVEKELGTTGSVLRLLVTADADECLFWDW